MTGVAYLRRSSDRNGGAESYEAQKAAVLDLAKRNGEPEPELIVEWGRSGADAGMGSRPLTARMCVRSSRARFSHCRRLVIWGSS